MQVILKVFPQMKREKTLINSLCEANIALYKT